MSDSREDVTPPVVLDAYRGMAAQKETDVRRHLSEVEADQVALRQDLAEREKFMFAAPTTDWPGAAAKAAYLLKLYAASPDAQDPRLKQMIESVLDDFQRLAR